MLWAYFDDGGGLEREGMSVALGGSLARLENWRTLLPQWEAIVGNAGQSWFHATEWRQRGSDLQEQWERLVQLANESVIAHIGCVVPAYRVRELEEKRRGRHRELDRGDSETAG